MINFISILRFLSPHENNRSLDHPKENSSLKLPVNQASVIPASPRTKTSRHLRSKRSLAIEVTRIRDIER